MESYIGLDLITLTLSIFFSKTDLCSQRRSIYCKQLSSDSPNEIFFKFQSHLVQPCLSHSLVLQQIPGQRLRRNRPAQQKKHTDTADLTLQKPVTREGRRETDLAAWSLPSRFFASEHPETLCSGSGLGSLLENKWRKIEIK